MALSIEFLLEQLAQSQGETMAANVRADIAEAERDQALEENERLRDRAAVGRPAKHRSPAEWRFRVKSWQWLEYNIWPKADPQPKLIRVLRVYVPLEDKDTDTPYWDWTSKRVQATLEPILPYLQESGAYVTVGQLGEGLGSRYQVNVEAVKSPQ